MHFERWNDPRLADINAVSSRLGAGQFYIVNFTDTGAPNAWGWAYLYDEPEEGRDPPDWDTGFTSPEAALKALELFAAKRHVLYAGNYL